MVMNTNPKNEDKAYGDNTTWQLGYFHECMSGFEHQVAAHMMAEGMVDESLTLTRVIHDRHHAAKRNPLMRLNVAIIMHVPWQVMEPLSAPVVLVIMGRKGRLDLPLS
jgi:uncharacterized protein (DUF608 family)